MPKLNRTSQGIRSLQLRIFSATVGLPLLIGALLIEELFAFIAISAWLAAYRELCTLLPVSKIQPIRIYSALLGSLIIGLALWGGVLVIAVAFTGLMLLLAITLLRLGFGNGVKDWGVISSPILFVSMPLASAVLLRGDSDGLEWVLLALGATFSCDTFAYIFGSLFGRRQMAPRISPNKTWEGSLGGFVGAMVATVTLLALFRLEISLPVALALGGLIGIVAQGGDLLESWIKRTAGVKNSGVFLPGHGGILDRLDSLVPVFPLVYYISKL
jgi:phosphatidate cytidylyltransferase